MYIHGRSKNTPTVSPSKIVKLQAMNKETDIHYENSPYFSSKTLLSCGHLGGTRRTLAACTASLYGCMKQSGFCAYQPNMA